MKVGARLALGVAIGYVLGRTHKMRLAVTLVAAGAAGKDDSNPAELLRQGTKLLENSPELKGLTEDMRGRLVEAGKAAAVTAAMSRIDSLTGRLQQRAEGLRQPERSGRRTDEDQESYEDDQPYEEDSGEYREDGEQRSSRRRGRVRSGARGSQEPEESEESEPEDAEQD